MTKNELKKRTDAAVAETKKSAADGLQRTKLRPKKANSEGRSCESSVRPIRCGIIKPKHRHDKTIKEHRPSPGRCFLYEKNQKEAAA
jgi:hypothetical protein